MLEKLKEAVFMANLMLPKLGLVTFTWGNVSGIDRASGLMAIKPSGVSYEALRASDIVIVDINTGKAVEGKLNPSSDTPTHIELYRAFKDIGGIVHTHSRWATSFAQAGRSIDAMGTTQADYFYGAIPCTRSLEEHETKAAYERNTGDVIVETFKDIDPNAVPGVLVKNHGPFAWGASPENAVHNAAVMEECAFMNFHALMLDRNAERVPQYILDKHYYRKHGENAYYGQKVE